MKILHIIPSYLPALVASGPIKPTHYLNRELVNRGHEVTVYTNDMDGNKRMKVKYGEPVYIDGVRVIYYRANKFGIWQYSKNMHKAIKKNIKEFDLIHITSVFLAISALGSYYARENNIPYIISPHGSLMKEPLIKKSSLIKKFYIKFIEKINLGKAAAIHFTVEREKEEFEELNIKYKKPIIIPNGIDFKDWDYGADLGSFRKKYNLEKNKIVLFLSRIVWKKGLDTLIKSFSKISKRYSDAVLVLAGGDDENYIKKVKEFIKEEKIIDKVLFTGIITGKEKEAAYLDSDVFVLPSYSENFGVVVVEAMYFGLPVIISKGVGLGSKIEKEEVGKVINKDTEEVYRAVIDILENKKESREIAIRAREWVQKEFSIEKVAERWVEEYNKIVIKN